MKVALALFVLFALTAVLATEVDRKRRSTEDAATKKADAAKKGDDKSVELTKDKSEKACKLAKEKFDKDTGSIWADKDVKTNQSTERKAKKADGQKKDESKGQKKDESKGQKDDKGKKDDPKKDDKGKKDDPKKSFLELVSERRRRRSDSDKVELEIAQPKDTDVILCINQEGKEFKLKENVNSYFSEKQKDKNCVIRLGTTDKEANIDLKGDLSKRVNVWNAACDTLLWPKDDKKDGSKKDDGAKKDGGSKKDDPKKDKKP